MALPEAYFVNNDMLVTLSSLQSTTAATTAYINSSTNVTASVWKTLSTASTANRIVNARVLSYIAASNGNYRTVIQSTESTGISVDTQGQAIIKVAHLGLNAEYRVPFRGQFRRTT